MAKAPKGSAKVQAIPLQTLTVEYVGIDAIKPNEYNPNRQSDQEFSLLVRSIKEDGMTQPVIVLRSSNVIVDGEHRWRACKEVGMTSIPVVYVDMTEEQRRVSTIRHNLARGSHDYQLEANVIKDLEKLGALEWAQEALQLDDVAIQRMLEDATPVDAYGAAHAEFNESWDYSPLSNPEIAGDDSATPGARLMQQMTPMERETALQRQGMQAKDAEIVQRHMTFTRQEVNMVNSALGDKPAETMLALAQAHVTSKVVAGRGEWTPLTLVVPTAALAGIMSELERLQGIAPNRNPDLTPELQRGLALEYMAVLSAQTPIESLT